MRTARGLSARLARQRQRRWSVASKKSRHTSTRCIMHVNLIPPSSKHLADLHKTQALKKAKTLSCLLVAHIASTSKLMQLRSPTYCSMPSPWAPVVYQFRLRQFQTILGPASKQTNAVKLRTWAPIITVAAWTYGSRSNLKTNTSSIRTSLSTQLLYRACLHKYARDTLDPLTPRERSWLASTKYLRPVRTTRSSQKLPRL